MTRTEALRKLYKKITNEEAPVGANTTTEALQKVYEALTNDTTHHINVTEIIDDLAANWSDSGGGGGSSDFSTATVTVTNSGTDAIYGAGCQFNDEDSTAFGDIYIEEDSVINLILYKGSSTISLINAIDKSLVSLSGDVEGVTDLLDSDVYDEFIVTGDCTITISSSTNL